MTWPMQGDIGEIARLTDVVTPMAMRVAATLRLADLIAAGACTPEALAEKAGADPVAVQRLLRYLAVRGVFAETSPGEFGLNETAEWLLDDHPRQVRAWLDLDGAMGHADRTFSALLHSIRTGEAAYPQVHGRSFWAELAAKPELTHSFDHLMSAGRTSSTLPAFLTLDWGDIKHVVDVGGGNGALLIELLSAQPHLRGTVVDLAETAETAHAEIAAAGLEDRCDVAVCSFFDPLPGHGDAYLLSSILHDWNDADAEVILRRCAEAAGEGNRVLIGDLVSTGEEDQVVFTHLDLRMLAYFGGRERTLEGFRALTAAAGLRLEQVTTADGGKSVVNCVVGS
jgi:SAM-dependent methyltransferase